MFCFQVGLLLISAVVPHLQKVRLGVDENIANVLAGFKIIPSPDKREVVKIIVYYIWCVEGEHQQSEGAGFQPCVSAAGTLFQKLQFLDLMGRSCQWIHTKANVVLLQCVTYLPWLCLFWSAWRCSWDPWFSIGEKRSWMFIRMPNNACVHCATLSWTHFCFWLCRENLKGLYRGDIYNVYNCQRNMRASRPALVCWMGYTSFSAAHICTGTYEPVGYLDCSF